jgi:hypothetical protein
LKKLSFLFSKEDECMKQKIVNVLLLRNTPFSVRFLGTNKEIEEVGSWIFFSFVNFGFCFLKIFLITFFWFYPYFKIDLTFQSIKRWKYNKIWLNSNIRSFITLPMLKEQNKYNTSIYIRDTQYLWLYFQIGSNTKVFSFFNTALHIL